MSPALWSLDEYVVVADLYLRRGRSSGVHDREVVRLAELTGRSPASISRRLGNFEGTLHPGRGLKPVTGEALATFENMAANSAVRSRLVEAAMARLRSENLRASIATNAAPLLVAPEKTNAESIEVVTPAQRRTMIRAEAALVRRYRSWLDPLGRRLRAWSIPVGDDVLRTDLYDEMLDLVIEAKAAVTRNMLRQAVGQLIDYRRYISSRPGLAVLLPEEPPEDLATLPNEVGIAVIWADDGAFHDSLGGALVERERA